MVASEVDEKERENTPFVSFRAASTTFSAGRRVQNRVSFDPKDRGPSGHGLANAPATSHSILYGLDQQPAACAPEKKRLVQQTPGSQCETICIGRTHAEERGSKTTAQQGLVSAEGELDIALHGWNN